MGDGDMAALPVFVSHYVKTFKLLIFITAAASDFLLTCQNMNFGACRIHLATLTSINSSVLLSGFLQNQRTDRGLGLVGQNRHSSSS